jgi:hypothetical protein
MFEETMARGRALGEAARLQARGRLAALLREEAPRGVAVVEVEAGVELAGRGLAARSLVDPALRWLAARRP